MLALSTTNLLLLAISAALWVVSYHANGWIMAFAEQIPGISLVFLPAGVRLVALMVGGLWAAAGIALGAFICTSVEFPGMDMGQALAISVTAGFAPYAALLVACRSLGVRTNLANLTAPHLPVIALSAAAGSALLHNLLFAAFSMTEWTDFGRHFAAMVTGDFIGSLLMLAMVVAMLQFWRKATRAA